jgi:hypothetical protein
MLLACVSTGITLLSLSRISLTPRNVSLAFRAIVYLVMAAFRNIFFYLQFESAIRIYIL